MRWMRWRLLGAALLGLAGVAPTAQAFRMSITNVTSTGESPTTLAVGDTVTIDLAIENQEGRGFYGIGLIAYGYDVDRDFRTDDGLRVVGASAVDSLFNLARTPDGRQSGGMPAVGSPHELAGDDGPIRDDSPESAYWLFGGLSLAEVGQGDGSLDTGLGGRTIAEGDAHFRIVFQATSLPAARILTLRFGSGPPGYGEGVVVRDGRSYPVLPVEDAALHITVLGDPARGASPVLGIGQSLVPEPGSAVLLGFGLGALGLRRFETSRRA